MPFIQRRLQLVQRYVAPDFCLAPKFLAMTILFHQTFCELGASLARRSQTRVQFPSNNFLEPPLHSSFSAKNISIAYALVVSRLFQSMVNSLYIAISVEAISSCYLILCNFLNFYKVTQFELLYLANSLKTLIQIILLTYHEPLRSKCLCRLDPIYCIFTQ